MSCACCPNCAIGCGPAMSGWSGSRRYRSFEERLISPETLTEYEGHGPLPIAVDADFERFIAERRTAARRAAGRDRRQGDGDLLPDVTLDKGALKITPIDQIDAAGSRGPDRRASTPCCRGCGSPTCWRRWTAGPASPTASPICAPASRPPTARLLMTGLLADGLNLGLTRMAEACRVASLGQLAWTADWHIRDETYALALRRLVDHQHREPLAAHVRRRLHVLLGRPVLPGRRLRPRRRRRQRPLRPRAGCQVLHPPFRPLSRRSTPR